MIKEYAWAKLNLNLHLLPQKLSNGLYPVKFFNCQIDLADELIFEKKNDGIEIICQNPQVPKGEKNLIYQAAILLKKISKNKKLGARITLQKNIPIRAGFGGGSSDGAATVRGLSKLWKIKLSKKQTFALAGKLGKDVFYCLEGGLCEVKKDGSEVNSLPFCLPTFWLVVIVPEKEKPSTAWMYNNLDSEKIGRNLDKLAEIKQAIEIKNKKEILNNLFNDFETLAVSFDPEIRKIKEDLIKSGAEKTLLAGSGLAVVGFFMSKAQALKARDELLKIYPGIIYAKTK